MSYTKLEIETMSALREKLCSRIRQYDHKKFPPGTSPCDGRSLVCGFCETTALQQMEEIQRRVPKLSAVFAGSPE